MARSRSSSPSRAAAGSAPKPLAFHHLDLDDRSPVLATHGLAGLVGRHREQPGLQALGVSDGAELAPGDRPGRLGRIVGDVLVLPETTKATRTMSAW